MRMSVVGIVLLALALSLFLSGCNPFSALPPEAQEEFKEEILRSVPEKEGEECLDYVRGGVTEEHCATCGDGVCESFETCTPSLCNGEMCTDDCGPLHCTADCGGVEVSSPNKLPEVTSSLRTCRNDDECVRVSADCCGCSAGGQALALNEESVAAWEATLKTKCGPTTCLAVMSDHWTCSAEPKCIKNKCTLVAV